MPSSTPKGARGARGQQGATGARGARGPAGPVHITRAEFDKVVGSMNESIHELRTQFRRIADMQADIDALKRAIAKLIPEDGA